MAQSFQPGDPGHFDFLSWLTEIAPAAMTAIFGAIAAAALTFFRDRVNIRAGVNVLARRFDQFVDRYERDEEMRLGRWHETVRQQQQIASDLTVHREDINAKLATILERLGAPTDAHVHRRETDA